jgi:hypothetical protein
VTRHPGVHPFPARMAPDFAAGAVAGFNQGATVLDPMMGSGTFPIAAARMGCRGIGFDSDPLAVVIANTAVGGFDIDVFLSSASDVVLRAKSGTRWQPEDRETRDFIDYWFDHVASDKMGRLSDAIRQQPTQLQPMLWCALSRLVVTKDVGVSRARDVSHSRPHRTRERSDIDAFAAFTKAATTIAARVPAEASIRNRTTLSSGDARALPLPDASVDAILTSPPYLAAIDYLRGHRLALVWMGHTITELRSLRAGSIGTVRGLHESGPHVSTANRFGATLSARGQRQLSRYVVDLDTVAEEMRRVVKGGGTLLMVVGTATLEGTQIDLPGLVSSIVQRHGFESTSRSTRPIENSRRYLPPPSSGSSALSGRLREESVLNFTAH